MPHSSRRRGACIALCALLLLPTAALAAGGASPLGTLHSNGQVYVGVHKALAASALYSGDWVSTADGRATLSLARGTRILIDRESLAGLRRADSGVVIGLERGRLAWTMGPKTSVQVETDGLTLTPAGSFPSLAEVAMRADGSLVLSVHRGTVAVGNLRDAPVLVSSGKFITISPRLAQGEQAKSQPVGTGAHGKMTLGEKLRTFRIGNLSHAASVAIVGAIFVGAATAAIVIPMAVGDEEPASPSTP